MQKLEKVNVQDLCDNISEHIDKTKPFAVTRHGETIGYYLPVCPGPSEGEKFSLHQAGEVMDRLLTEQKITEDELVQDFRDLREGKRFL